MYSKDWWKEFFKEYAPKVGTAIGGMITVGIIYLCSSCSSVQKISVKQEQGDQVQETTIESNTTIKELTFLFTNKEVTLAKFP